MLVFIKKQSINLETQKEALKINASFHAKMKHRGFEPRTT